MERYCRHDAGLLERACRAGGNRVRLVQAGLKGGSMETVGSYEAKTHLPRLLERVAKGETITITKHGVPVARLVPVEAKTRPDVKQAIEQILEFRKAHPLNGEDLKEWINQGRRL